jgi:ATP-binding cassette subfamily E protein 1
LIVEHDLAILDYLSDFVCVLYGEASAYGVVTQPFGVREGINIFLEGFIPNENMRFRDYGLSFRVSDNLENKENKHIQYKYQNMVKIQGTFEL